MSDEQEVGVIFPVAGLDVTCEFGRQPVDTTPDAENVRTYDAIASRARGGGRIGLSRFIDETVNGDAVIQHLAVLVDPQNPALNSDDDTELVADPSTNNLSERNPGRTVRQGGSGRQPNRTRPNNITFVQKTNALLGTVSTPQTFTLDVNPNVGDLIVVFVVLEKVSSGSSPTVADVKNGGLLDFSRVGGAGYSAVETIVSGTTNTYDMSVWYSVAAGLDDQTVRVNPGGAAIMEYAAVVYRGAATGGPFTNKAKSEEPTLISSLSVTGLLLNGTPSQLVLVGAYSAPTPTYGSPPTNYTARVSGGSNIKVFERTNASGVGPEDFTVSYSVGTAGNVGVAAAFHK